MPDVSFSSALGKDGKTPTAAKSAPAGFNLAAQNQGLHPAAPATPAVTAGPAATLVSGATAVLSGSETAVTTTVTKDRTGIRFALNLLLVLASLVLVAGAFWWGQSLKALLASEQAALQQKQTALTRLEQQIATEQGKQTARLGRLATQAQEIHKRSLPWMQIISAVEAVLPKEAQIFSYSGRYLYDDRSQVGRNIISIQGVVDTYGRIADLIDALEQTDLFSHVQFDGSSKSVAEDGSEAVQLKLSFDLNPADRTTDELVAATSPKVVAFGEEGSDSVSVAPLALQLPLPPTKLAAKSIPVRPNEGKIQLTWLSAAAALHAAAGKEEGTNNKGDAKDRGQDQAGLAVASYLVQINQVGETVVETKEITVTNPDYPTYSFTYLTTQPQQKYEFKVLAKDVAGQLSASSETVVAKAADDSIPGQPQFVVQQTTRSLAPDESFREEVHLVWQAGNVSESDLHRYHLYVGTDPDDLRLLATLDTKTTTYSYKDKVSGKPLYFRVVAEDTSGNVSAPQINPLKLAAVVPTTSPSPLSTKAAASTLPVKAKPTDSTVTSPDN